jgi:hypothetical protein
MGYIPTGRVYSALPVNGQGKRVTFAQGHWLIDQLKEMKRESNVSGG